MSSDLRGTGSLDVAALHKEFESKARDIGMTELGRAWALEALDPFHDVDFIVSGMPDVTGGRSFVRNIRKELSITNPAAVPFDCHIAFLPNFAGQDISLDNCLNSTIDMTRSTSFGQVAAPTAGDTFYAAPNPADPTFTAPILAVCIVPAGNATFDPTSVASATRYYAIHLDELAAMDRSRLIGGAYEVHNVTEELHKSGAVTDYRVDAATGAFNFAIPAATAGLTNNWYTQGQLGTLPPQTISDAKQINGITRAASAGSLVPLVFDDLEYGVSFPEACHMISAQNDGDGAVWDCFTTMTNTAVTLPARGQARCRSLPFMQSGSYFTGLSAETVLNLSFHCFVETFPSPGDNLMSISSPSPSLDLHAVTVVSWLQSQMLAGYPVDENARGDFFRKVMGGLRWLHRNAVKGGRLVRDVSSVIASVPIPEVQALAKGVNRAANTALKLDDAATKIVRPRRRR